ncbi:hypothetical protein AB833_16375 [Chromatiales bacterium (ex Bugula neritina AB1)]|nr:hypothetical protein AB833_16375 [Chromatiales bacterium (ex Bugula neritina AB1)]
MELTSLDVASVRNLSQLHIEPSAGINVIYGDNGAGKTSLLEAISILATGKSFRSGRIETIISSGSDELLVRALLNNDERNEPVALGISRSKEKTKVRVDGLDIKRLSELASNLPCIAISARNHELIEGGPGERRSFIDWITFHVEQSYIDITKRYRNALQQRNAAIRSGAGTSLITSWDKELVTAGEQITNHRQVVIREFISYFEKLTSNFPVELKPQFVYRQGWSENLSLQDALTQSLDHSRRLGTTTAGPHRADIKIRLSQHEARYVNSRGQQKLLAVLMKLVQIELFKSHRGQTPILLFDDPPSELDLQAQKFVFSFLKKSGVQVFLTSVDDVSEEIQNVSTRFHVERGVFKKVLY